FNGDHPHLHVGIASPDDFMIRRGVALRPGSFCSLSNATNRGNSARSVVSICGCPFMSVK
ncbi:MAG: hypothetical protein OXM02_02955, partial [Bacteroidota bacterium]|nr:hypothetical protein [Bacteroidota bacterium]